MTLPAFSPPAAQAPEIRFYQVGEGPRTWYAVTCGRLVAAATRSFARACQYYAWERGVPRAQIGGPTHQVADARELSRSVHQQGQEGGV
jgi:hypothetical protein